MIEADALGDRARAADNPARPVRTPRWLGQAGPCLVVASCTFNMLLCFINTKHWAQISTPQIALVSLVILALGAILVRRELDPGTLAFAAVVSMATLGLALINPGLDLKILFDIAIPPVFVLLGRQSSMETAERMLRILVVLVITVGLTEMWFIDWFQTQLDILNFYANKGLIDLNATNYNGNQFFTSAERSGEGGRGMLAFLFGPHRASSIFLEPISMGNFPVICLAWLLSTRLHWGLSRWLLLGGVAFCVVLPDSRYAAASCVMLLALRVAPWRGTAVTAAALPIGTMLALLLLGEATLGASEAPNLQNDDFAGRLIYSGKLLASWHWYDWLNIDPTPMYTSDTGYAYLIKGVGLFTALGLVFRFAAGRLAAEPGTMRGMVALYAATSLCVGASFFSIKTAALLWYLYGASQTRRGAYDTGALSRTTKSS